jgi:hypothetical protein
MFNIKKWINYTVLDCGWKPPFVYINWSEVSNHRTKSSLLVIQNTEGVPLHMCTKYWSNSPPHMYNILKQFPSTCVQYTEAIPLHICTIYWSNSHPHMYNILKQFPSTYVQYTEAIPLHICTIYWSSSHTNVYRTLKQFS